MRTLLLTITVLISFINDGQTQKIRIDTLRIYDEKGTGYLTPLRPWNLNERRKGKKKLYWDPIEVSGQTINKSEKPYYLISYDKNRIKRIEGDYFDEFPCGIIMEYDSFGRKKLEGQFELRLYKRPPTFVKSRLHKLKKKYYHIPMGTWTYFSDNGKIIRKEEYNSKNALITTYDMNGLVIKSESIKNKMYKKTKERPK